MFCTRCGKPIEEGARFCGNCGARVAGTEDVKEVRDEAVEKERKPERKPEQKPRKHNTKKQNHGGKKSFRKMWVVAAVIIVCFLAGGSVYATAGLERQKENLAKKIEKSDVPEYVEELKEEDSKWENFGFADVSKKKTVIRKLEKIDKNVEKFQTCSKNLKAMKKEKKQYRLDEESYAAYEEALENCTEAFKEKKAQEALELFAKAEEAFEQLQKSNEDYIEEKIEKYEEADMGEAESEDVDNYNKYIKSIRASVKKKDYEAVKKTFVKMDEIIQLYVEPENPLEFTIQQVDASKFPEVKLYVSIKNPQTGEVPGNLDQSLFYIKKEDANQKYVKQVVTSVNQLNEEEALKVDMVADVSGSMAGQPLSEAKAIMSNFINSVQFDAGDLVELTSFATGVRLEREFCDDPDLLINDINALTTDNMTSLYDALYAAVERTATQTGARCVIAFTDGNDNYSSCTIDEVIAVAKRYHVPIFIIGIGSIDYADISTIASQTGGAYYSISDVYSMESIYNQIYQMEKELYMVEFEDNTGATAKEQANIEAGYRSMEYGGNCRYTYTPNVLLNANSSNIYKDGPEAVVETYLKNFAKAVTNSDFSLLSGCMKEGSAIYEEQKKYVQRDINETLDSYEITDVKYNGNSACEISTRETYYVQVKGKPLQLMTQECTYALKKYGSDWKMTEFVDIKVVSRIKQ